MSNTSTIKNVKAGQLPDDLINRLGIERDALVDITVTPAKAKQGFDRAAFEKVVAEMRALPVLDERSAEDIIGYDEHGLPQ